MSKQNTNTWNIDLTKQVNIIIGAEFGKTTLLKSLYYNAAKNIDALKSFDSNCGIGFVPCDSSIYNNLSESQSRLKNIYDMLEAVNRFAGPKLLIIDNIERGLHLDVQKTLISDLLVKGGPNLKIICSTHSPTVYYKDWIDCVVRANE